MQLLVSVMGTLDAAAALDGGADLIDAKDPAAGALGAVSIDQFHRIVGTVAGRRPVTAALGDASDEAVVERSAGAFAAAGAAFAKIGFAGITRPDCVSALIAAAARGAEVAAANGCGAGLPASARDENTRATARLAEASPARRRQSSDVAQDPSTLVLSLSKGELRAGFSPAIRRANALRHFPEKRGAVVAVAYADAGAACSIPFAALVDIAVRAGAAGVLLDTFDKRNGGLRDLIAPQTLSAWVAAAHDAGLFVALAGKLTASDLPFVRDAGADIAGVRGAACDGGRTGHVNAARVRALRAECAVPDVCIAEQQS